MFLWGNDAAAKLAVSRLTEEIGFEAVDAGPLTSAQGLGPDIAFKLRRR
jgi:predicted dinucleotide-binding enzyme